MKCGAKRLFRTNEAYDRLTVDECYDICHNTPGCNYFSLGVNDYLGVCIGCSNYNDLEVTTYGFHAFEITARNFALDGNATQSSTRTGETADRAIDPSSSTGPTTNPSEIPSLSSSPITSLSEIPSSSPSPTTNPSETPINL